MSLFACEKCGVVENTATTTGSLGYDFRGDEMVKVPRLCSLCHDGKWHGLFPREQADNGKWHMGKFGLERIASTAPDGEGK